MNKSKPVKVRVFSDTIKKVDKIKKFAHLSTRSNATKMAIDIAVMVIEAIKRGDRIVIESQDGLNRDRLIIPGI